MCHGGLRCMLCNRRTAATPAREPGRRGATVTAVGSPTLQHGPGRPDGPPTVTVGGLRFFKSSRRQPPGRGVAAAGRVGRPAPGPQRRCHGHGTGCRLCRFAPPSPLYPSVRRSLTGPRGRLEAAHSVTAVTLTPQRHPGRDRKCGRNRTVPACLPLACLFFRHS